MTEVRYVPINVLKPNPQNARTHSRKQSQALAKSIQRFGWTSLIVVDEDYNIIAGHGRLEAARLLGLQIVPVHTKTGLSKSEQTVLAIADNKIATMAGWDRTPLTVQFQEIIALPTESNLSLEFTGFETAEVDSLLNDARDSESDPADDLPAVSRYAVSTRGDLFVCGSHRLLCGDATNPDDVRNLMGRERATVVFTDPPYNVRIASIQGRGRIKHREFAQASGEMSKEEFTSFLRGSLGLAAQYSTDGSIHFVCMDWRHFTELKDAGDEVYTELKNVICWDKTHAGMGSFYRSRYELIFAFKNGAGAHINNFELGQHGRNRSNVWAYPGANGFKSDRMVELAMHPTVKPVAMIVDAMRDCSRRGDIVLDPFLGSGTTILAAERVGRRGFGLEIDPLYADAAIRRWQDFTGRDATLERTGQTFDELAVERLAERGTS